MRRLDTLQLEWWAHLDLFEIFWDILEYLGYSAAGVHLMRRSFWDILRYLGYLGYSAAGVVRQSFEIFDKMLANCQRAEESKKWIFECGLNRWGNVAETWRAMFSASSTEKPSSFWARTQHWKKERCPKKVKLYELNPAHEGLKRIVEQQPKHCFKGYLFCDGLLEGNNVN